MNVLARRQSSMSELASSPTSIISCGRDYLSDHELALRWKLLDAQRQRGIIAQSRYEAKQQDLLRLCSNDDFRDLVLKNSARLVEGEIDQAGYDKRVRFLCDQLGGSAPLLEAYGQFEEKLTAKEAQDKKSRLEKPLSPELISPGEARFPPSEAEQDWAHETAPGRPRRRSSASTSSVRSPEEEKFFASEADQGWTFDTGPRTRTRSSDSTSSLSRAATNDSSKDGNDTKRPSSTHDEPRSPEEQKFFASDADQGWTFETEPRTRKRSSDSTSSASYAPATGYS